MPLPHETMLGWTPVRRAEVHDAAKQLQALDHVVGVFWGEKFSSGRWTGEGSLLCQVNHKGRPKRSRCAIPPVIHDLKTDVVEIGRGPRRAFGISSRSKVEAWGGGRWGRASAVATSVDDATRSYALLCGHSSNPFNPFGTVERYYDGTSASLQADGSTSGTLYIGRVSRYVDFAVAEFPTLSGITHPVTGTLPPYPWADPSQVPYGTELEMWSRVQKSKRKGFLRGAGVSPLRLKLPTLSGSDWQRYQVYTVDGANGAFARPGDSGALIFASGVVIGTVVGGIGSTTYLLPVPPLVTSLRGAGFHQYFFQ